MRMKSIGKALPLSLSFFDLKVKKIGPCNHPIAQLMHFLNFSFMFQNSLSSLGRIREAQDKAHEQQKQLEGIEEAAKGLEEGRDHLPEELIASAVGEYSEDSDSDCRSESSREETEEMASHNIRVIAPRY